MGDFEAPEGPFGLRGAGPSGAPDRLRNQLLDETEKQACLLREEIARTDSVAGNLSATLSRDRAQYGEMVARSLPQLQATT